MDTTTMRQPTVKIPHAYRMPSLARQAYRMGFLEGYKLAVKYIEQHVKVDDGAFPPAPPEFIGREIATRAWRDGCVAGAVQATRDSDFTTDLLLEAEQQLGELDAADPVPVFVGASLASPKELRDTKRADWLEADAAAKRAELISAAPSQSVVDAEFADMDNRPRPGAAVVAVGVILVFGLVVAIALVLLLSGCSKDLPSFH